VDIGSPTFQDFRTLQRGIATERTARKELGYSCGSFVPVGLCKVLLSPKSWPKSWHPMTPRTSSRTLPGLQDLASRRGRSDTPITQYFLDFRVRQAAPALSLLLPSALQTRAHKSQALDLADRKN